MSAPAHVERASMEDLPIIWRIVEAFDPNPIRRTDLLYTVNARECLVAKVGWDVCGVAVRRSGFFGYSLVTLVVVHETYRRAGVARTLMAYAEKTAGSDRLFATANAENPDGAAFLMAIGYTHSGDLRGLTDDDTHQSFYVKYLPTD